MSTTTDVIGRLGVYTLDGNEQHKGLLQFVCSEEQLDQTSFVICIDYSKPWCANGWLKANWRSGEGRGVDLTQMCDGNGCLHLHLLHLLLFLILAAKETAGESGAVDRNHLRASVPV